MIQVPMDPCLLYSRDSSAFDGIPWIQVDDTLFGGTKIFLGKEEIFS